MRFASIAGASATPAEFDSGLYDRNKRLVIYQELLKRADEFLQQNVAVVLDGAFPWVEVPEKGRDGGEASNEAIFFRCVCPEAVALERIARRMAVGNSFSEVRPDLYESNAKKNRQLPICRALVLIRRPR